MPAVIPARPSGGAVVDTAWGQDVHDRIYTPKAVIAGGNATAVPANVATSLDLRNLISGNGAWLAGDNITLKVPVGHSGWFAVEVSVTVAAGPAAAVPVRLAVVRNGGVLGGNTVPVVGPTIATYIGLMLSAQGNDNDAFTLQGFSTSAVSLTVTRVTIRRIFNVPSGS